MKALSPEVSRVQEEVVKAKLAEQDKKLNEEKQESLKKQWDVLEKPNNPSVKQLSARVEVLEKMLGLK